MKTTKWEEDFEENFVADDILDCIPKSNWEEMKSEVKSFIQDLIDNQKKEIVDNLPKSKTDL